MDNNKIRGYFRHPLGDWYPIEAFLRVGYKNLRYKTEDIEYGLTWFSNRWIIQKLFKVEK